MHLLNIISLVIGTIGIVVIIWGILLVILEFLYGEYTALFHKKSKLDKNYLRRHLGSYILLGLEFMVAADIIHTLIRPNKEGLIVLGAIVAIRTVISYFLHKEIQSTE